MANSEGKAYALTVLTPMPWWTRVYRRVVFFLIHVVHWPKRDQVNLAKLSFIHFARWVVIRRSRFPWLGHPQPRERLHYDYLLFCSNFNGGWGEYLDAFSDVIPRGVNNIWRWCIKYPKARPISPFLGYAAFNQIDTDYFYNAYPGASTRDIKAALELHAQLETFAKEPRTGLSDSEFRRKYEAFLTRIQGCLGTIGP
ncbi:MAG TPA: hypothetical protein VE091_10270 [Gemmatimonadales bacterium]|nr:hypothetical protein [Gemmatimonadales bacterium]